MVRGEAAHAVAKAAPAADKEKPTIGKGDLQKIEDAPSAVDSFIATIDYLQANQTLKADVASLVKMALKAQRAALEPAIKANVHT